MRRKKIRLGGLKDINSILKNVIGEIEKKDPGRKDKINEAWKKAVGIRALKHSWPTGIKKNILNIEVDSSSQLYILNIQKRKLLTSINKTLFDEKIHDIRFRMGEGK